MPACNQTGYHSYSVIVNRTNTGSESITWYLDGSAYFTVAESQVGTYRRSRSGAEVSGP